MKRFKSSELSTNRAKVMEAARSGGAIIEERRTNGQVIDEFILTANASIYLHFDCDGSVRCVSVDEINEDPDCWPMVLKVSPDGSISKWSWVDGIRAWETI